MQAFCACHGENVGKSWMTLHLSVDLSRGPIELAIFLWPLLFSYDNHDQHTKKQFTKKFMARVRGECRCFNSPTRVDAPEMG